MDRKVKPLSVNVRVLREGCNTRKDMPTDTNIRVYNSAPDTIALQIRDFARTERYKTGSSFVIAHANLTREQALELHDLLDLALAEK